MKRVNGPLVHNNLAVYFLSGESQPGPIPLSLQEALGNAQVRLYETTHIHELRIENVGDKEVFLQAGDIVKGGWQDRTLNATMVLPPLSGTIPVASFCVEAGRWAARGREDASSFAASARSVPSRAMKLAMNEQVAPSADPDSSRHPPGRKRMDRAARILETALRQRKVWDGVRSTQEKLQQNLGHAVRSRLSETSLELSLDNDKLQKAIRTSVDVLAPGGEQEGDIIGCVFAVNGRISSADVYPSNGLFRKMWRKQLDAGIIEAITEQDGNAVSPPPPAEVEAFLSSADKGVVSSRQVACETRMVSHESDHVLVVEARRADGFLHRTYLAK